MCMTFSLRFHLERKTGGLSRVLDRGKLAIDLIARMIALNLAPTVLEVLFVCLLFGFYFGWAMVAIVVVMIGLYAWFSFHFSERRIAIRRDYIDADMDATTKAVDSLLNYETVKYFGNERWEAARFDRSMERFQEASVRSWGSLAILNSGQALIFTAGMVLAMLLAARGVAMGTMTVGDFVLVNAVFIQLYQPLNLMGMIYRETKQALVDIEAMFALLGRRRRCWTRPAPRRSPCQRVRSASRMSSSPMTRSGLSCAASISRCRRVIWWRSSGRRARANRQCRGFSTAFTT